MGANVKQALKDACTGMAGSMKQIFEEMKVLKEQERQQQIARLNQQQQFLYQTPIGVKLTPQQLSDIEAQLYYHPAYSNADVLLTQPQILDVVDTFVYQAVANRDYSTMCALRNILIPNGLDFNLEFLRTLHEELFNEFIAKFHPELSYASVTPSGTFFLITADGYGFYYKINMSRPAKKAQYEEEFRRFSNTAAASDLRNRYGLNSYTVSFDEVTKNLILFLR